MGNCRDCRWWERLGWEKHPDDLMYCSKIEGIGYQLDAPLVAAGTFAYCDDSFGNGVAFVTAPDFGCVLFEAKA